MLWASCLLSWSFSCRRCRQLCFQRLQDTKRGKTEHPVLLSVPVSFPLEDYESATQLVFEKFHALGLYVLQQPLAAVYSHGLVTGLVIDLGHETTGMLALYELTDTISPRLRDLRSFLHVLRWLRYHARHR